MAERFEAVYSDEQREAVASAFNDRGIRPARRVAELAAAGELDGLAPFAIPIPSVLDLARKQRMRRSGEHTSELAKQPPRDAVEQLRRRIVNVADRMVAALERQRPEKVDPERVRQAARAIRECAAIPGPTDPPPAKPGHSRDPDGRTSEGATRSGPVGTLLAAARGSSTAHDTERDSDDTRQHDNDAAPTAAPDADADADDQAHDTEHDAPGDFARAQLARVADVRGAAAGSSSG